MSLAICDVLLEFRLNRVILRLNLIPSCKDGKYNDNNIPCSSWPAFPHLSSHTLSTLACCLDRPPTGANNCLGPAQGTSATALWQSRDLIAVPNWTILTPPTTLACKPTWWAGHLSPTTSVWSDPPKPAQWHYLPHTGMRYSWSFLAQKSPLVTRTKTARIPWTCYLSATTSTSAVIKSNFIEIYIFVFLVLILNEIKTLILQFAAEV